MNSLAQDDLTPLHYAARYTPKGTADMDVEGPLQEIDLTAPLPPTQVCFTDHTLLLVVASWNEIVIFTVLQF